ncbi:hypothetical protein [Cryptosporangium aurantiacum]|uniref:Low temperature requirement A protein (LtrA) n=1 Tax=Cryptosporangium aurantiacum TaxID=134849 RepID=A0A1M7MF07_9ACTN|nr:hypothetical protein [Cryptosporangium aurantiacum]SHM89459.1 hypothetical protein SAMN05443668_102100 [Cryptosporangium aurantiacum]
MRRLLVVLAGTLAVLSVASPASAFAHDRVTNPYLHAALDVLTLAAVTAPLWTAYFWGRRNRRALLALVAGLQLPVAVVAFVPIPDPRLHALALVSGLALTAASILTVRHAVSDEEPATT